MNNSRLKLDSYKDLYVIYNENNKILWFDLMYKKYNYKLYKIFNIDESEIIGSKIFSYTDIIEYNLLNNNKYYIKINIGTTLTCADYLYDLLLDNKGNILLIKKL